MSINKAKLYIGYYFSYILVPLYFVIMFTKEIFEGFFKTLKETTGMIKEAHRVFNHKKQYSDNQ